MGTRGQWGIDFAKALGNANPSAETVNWIAAWTKGENTEAKFNPLATTLDYGENTNFNYAGVKNYKTREQGIQASIATLQGNYPGYADIREGIRTDNPRRASAGLIRAPWGTNGGLVQNTWLTQDVRNEELKSESGEVVQSGSGTPNNGHDSGPVSGHYTPGQSSAGSNENPKQRLGKADDTRIGTGSTSENAALGARILYGLAGSGMLVVALFLIIRNYVPTQTVVKTIAEVAG